MLLELYIHTCKHVACARHGAPIYMHVPHAWWRLESNCVSYLIYNVMPEVVKQQWILVSLCSTSFTVYVCIQWCMGYNIIIIIRNMLQFMHLLSAAMLYRFIVGCLDYVIMSNGYHFGM